MTPRPLADLLPAAAALIGVPGDDESGWLSKLLEQFGPSDPPRHVVVLLIDGLGARQLDAHASLTPTLSGLIELGPLAAPFPSTTCASLTSFGTGLPPGMHGIVGSSFRLDDGSTLAPLTWKETPNPIATQPEPTVFERVAAAGALVVSVAPAAHRVSGLTRAALRGGEYAGAESVAQRVALVGRTLARARTEGRPSLVYVYWPALDKIGHGSGVDSPQYRAELVRVDSLAAGLAGLVDPDVLLLVTADHGLVDVPDDRRFDLDARPALRVGVETILGEPRVRHVYTQPGRAGDVARIWAGELGERARILSRDEASALLGPVDEWYADRIGDVVAIAQDDWALVSDRVDRIVSGLRGQHGALTDDEVLVPLRMLRG